MLRNADRREEYLEHFEGAVERAHASSDERMLSVALNGLAQYYRDGDAWARAAELYLERAAVCDRLGDRAGRAHATRHAGEVRHEDGRLEEARDLLMEAVEIYRALADPPRLDVANAVRPLALLLTETAEIGRAKILWAEARELYASLGIEEGVQEADNWLERIASM